MKKIIVSRETFPSVFTSCKNLEQVVVWIEAHGRNSDMVVTKMKLNDRFLDEDEENLLSSLGIKEIKSIEVEYKDIPNLIGDTMKSIISLLQELQIKSISQAEILAVDGDFSANGVKEIFAKCRILLSTLEEVFQVHSRGKFNLKHFSLWRESEKELSGILQCILQGTELNDPVLVSELFAGAFPEALSHWEEVLEKEILDNIAISSIFNLNSPVKPSDNGVDA